MAREKLEKRLLAESAKDAKDKKTHDVLCDLGALARERNEKRFLAESTEDAGNNRE